MASRIRTIKPDFFRHEALYEAECETGLPLRIAFAGLWTVADREGRFQWRPRILKLDVLPFDEVDFSRVLDALASRGFIVKYAAGGQDYGHIPSWTRHQVINNREAASTLPAPGAEACPTREARVPDAAPTLERRDADAQGTPLVQVTGEGKGREGKNASMTRPSSSDGITPELETKPDKPGKATRLKAEWTLPPPWRDWASAEYPHWTPATIEAIAAGFRDHWIAKPGKDGTKLDWEATWRNWCRSDITQRAYPPPRQQAAAQTPEFI